MNSLTIDCRLAPTGDLLRTESSSIRAVFILVVACFCVLGLFMVPSSSTTARPTLRHQQLLVRHAAYLGFGCLVAYFCSRTSGRTWQRSALVLHLLSIAALALTLSPGVGVEVNGARRWLRIGPLSIQVSEIARVTTVLCTAYLASGVIQRQSWRLRDVANLAVPILVPVGLIVIEPDFGGALLVLVTGLLVVFLGGLPWRFTFVAAVVAGVSAACALLAEPYRLERVRQFLQTWKSVDGAPYQVRQSLLSFVSGGVWGTGLGAGWQKLGFLPESHTDYVFAVIGEELGLLGVFLVIAGWAVLVVCIWRLALRQTSPFRSLAILGLGTNLALQAAVHMGVVLALLPPKGLGLPFVSYGGSNLTMSLASVGIILALSRHPAAGSEHPKGPSPATGPV